MSDPMAGLKVPVDFLCFECHQRIPADEWGYDLDGQSHVTLVQVSEDEMEQKLCGPKS